MINNMCSEIYRHPNMNSKREKIEKWLDSKVSDDLIETKYDIEKHHIGVRQEDPTLFNMYYGTETGIDNGAAGDTDLKASNTFYTNLISKNKLLHEKLDDNLTFVDQVTENYDMQSVLIAPHSNRWHTNYLFKQMVDYCIQKRLFFDVGDKEHECLISGAIKDDFYEFCYDDQMIHKDKPTVSDM